MRDLIINNTVQHSVLLLVPLIFAILLKNAKLRGWSMIGGVIAGILLGPAVFGSVAPEYWEGLFQSGELEHKQLIQLEREQKADILAATTTGADENMLLQLRADHQYDRSLLNDKWTTAKWMGQRTLRDYALLVVFQNSA